MPSTIQPAIIEETQSKFILVDQSQLINLLRTASDLQEAIQIIDSSLIPVTKYNDGLLTSLDKTILDYLAVNASDKMYVYSNQEQGLINPVNRIIIADNEGLSIQYPDTNTARIGMSPFYNKIFTDNGNISPTVDNKSISFSNSDTVDVLITDGKIQLDATKTKQYALAMSLVFGG